MAIGVTGTTGSHPNFLSYALNVVHNSSELFDVPNTITFDNLAYPQGKTFDIKYYAEYWNEINPIRIIVDNELLWTHQLLCRCTGRFNVHIRYLEDNLFNFQQSLYDKFPRSEDRIHLNTNPIMTIFGDASGVAMKKYYKDKQKLLKFMYTEKIFDKFLPDFARPSVLSDAPENIYLVPMTDLYYFDRFDHHVKTLIPTRSLEISKKLHGQFMSNVIHTPENIDQNGSILVESWREYMVDRSPQDFKIKTSTKT